MRPTILPQVHGPRRTIASFKSYLEAQRAVDFLSDQGFPVQHVAINAEELRMVEQVLGRLDSGRAALQGLIRGGTIGAIVGLVLGLLSEEPTPGLMTRTIFIGVVVGTLSGWIGYALTGGKRDFSSVSSMQAGRYDVVVDEEHAAQAETVLGTMR